MQLILVLHSIKQKTKQQKLYENKLTSHNHMTDYPKEFQVSFRHRIHLKYKVMNESGPELNAKWGHCCINVH